MGLTPAQRVKVWAHPDSPGALFSTGAALHLMGIRKGGGVEDLIEDGWVEWDPTNKEAIKSHVDAGPEVKQRILAGIKNS
jgi:hypothetical protein